MAHKFDHKNIERLNNPERLKRVNVDVIWKEIDTDNVKTLVDVGAGTGLFAKEFAKKINTGVVHALDISDESVNWMKNNLGDELLNIIKPAKCGEVSLELPDNIADLVYNINVFHELEKPDASLTEFKRVLKTGGKLLIIDWKPGKMDFGPPADHKVNPEDVINNVKKAGFNKVKQPGKLDYHFMIIAEK